MPETRACPMCDGGEVVCREGRLEQSGDTYLPTTVSTCTICGYARFEPALGVRWRSEVESEPVPLAGRRRAA
jgi:rubredoxin